MSRRVVISGTGYSTIARRTDTPLGVLALQAATNALSEAGLGADDVDGLANFPTPGFAGAGSVDGVDYVSIPHMATALRVHNLRWQASIQPGDFVSSIIAGIHAITAGAADVVLVWRAMHNPASGSYGQLTETSASGDVEFTAPYGIGDAVSRYAMPYSGYLAKYGATREHMAAFVVNNRRNAAMNPDAIFFGKPITERDYLTSRMIVEPVSLLDCDMPVDGAAAIVLTTESIAQTSSQYRPAHIGGYATFGVNYGNNPLVLLEDHERGAAQAANALWRSTVLTPADVDTANLYDGFSYFTYLYLEALGFCKQGEAFEFIQDGRIAIDGELPLNTSGGSLGVGRLHGAPQVVESVRQIQRRCGDRQVSKADTVLAISGQPHSSVGYLLLTSDFGALRPPGGDTK